MHRRSFLSSLAVAGAAVSSGSRLFGQSANSVPKVGLIGCGWFGGVDLRNLVQHGGAHVASLCDVNARQLANLAGQVAEQQKDKPRTFADYREMLASTDHDIVIVATPDHWHALPAIAAMQAGADVFLEKPIGVDVIEGEALLAAARKYDRVAQINTQRRSNPAFEDAIEMYLQNGRLGHIGKVEGYSYLQNRRKDVFGPADVPGHLDYDAWTGPAPMIDYTGAHAEGLWRLFMEYCTGTIGDLGVHTFDQVRWMLGLGWPDAITSTGGILVDRDATANITDTQNAVFHYPNLEVSWEHRSWGVSPIPQRHWTDQWGARFIGDGGTLNVWMLGYEFTPADGGPKEGFHMCSQSGDLDNVDFSQWFNAYNETEKRHMLNFLAAREDRGRTRPVADMEQGHISSACIELANLSLELGRTLSYDPASRTVPGDTEATARLARPYRDGYTHPTPANV